LRGYLKLVIALLSKDFLVTARSPWELLALLVFSSLSAIPISLIAGEYAGQAFSIALLFITIYLSTQSYTRELRLGTLEIYQLYPIPPAAHFLEKLTYTATLLVLAALTLLATMAVFGVNARTVLELAVIAAASTVYLSAASSLASLIATYLAGESPLQIAVTATLAVPLLVSIDNSNPLLLAITGVAYSIVSLIIAELLESESLE